MPAIREAFYDGTGLWLELTTGPGRVGKTVAQIAALVPGGNPSTRLQRFQDALNATLQALCEIRIPLSSIPVDDPIKTVGPEVGCRIEGSDYVARIVEVFVPVLAISPSIVLGPIEISEAASRSVYV